MAVREYEEVSQPQTDSGVGPQTSETRVGPQKRSAAKPLIILGSVGAMIMAAGSMIYIVNAATSGYYAFYWSQGYPNYILAATIVLFVGVIFHSFAYLGFYSNHRSPMGLATFIFAIIASAMYLAFTVLSIEQQSYYYGLRYTMNQWYSYTGIMLLGMALIIMGSCLIVERRYFHTHPMLLTTGILQVISGSFIMSYFLVFYMPVGWVLLFVSAVFTTVALFTTVPTIGKEFVAMPAPYATGATATQPGVVPRFCPNCGRRTESTAYCGYCGERVAQ